ncbi:MAG TPA: ABC transporter permease [Vicinamibacterales bacterium]|nr:ABC transporter permease [Vicinamibacterales bacterium]
MRALWNLTWLELKIFAREPLGLVGTLLVPAVTVVGIGRAFGGAIRSTPSISSFVAVDLPVFAAVLAALNAVLSLVTIIAIYREGGILKRLRATPLRATTILSAHVLVKIIMTLATLTVMVAAGRRVIVMSFDARTASFALAAIVSMLSILSIGFVVASLVPTARFAQPVGGVLLYPMLFVCGLFAPVGAMPASLQAISRVVPLTYAVSLMKGIWVGDPWSAHVVDVGVLALFAAICTAISARVFRWE